MGTIDFQSHYQHFIHKNKTSLWTGIMISLLFAITAVTIDAWLLAVLGIGALFASFYTAKSQQALQAKIGRAPKRVPA